MSSLDFCLIESISFWLWSVLPNVWHVSLFIKENLSVVNHVPICENGSVFSGKVSDDSVPNCKALFRSGA